MHPTRGRKWRTADIKDDEEIKMIIILIKGT